MDYNWLGAPIVRDGQLIGMIVDQPLPESEDADGSAAGPQSSEPTWFAITYPSMEQLLKIIL